GPPERWIRHAIDRDPVVDDRVHGKVVAEVGGAVVGLRQAVGGTVLVVGIPAPVRAEPALHARHATPGIRSVGGVSLDLRIPDLVDGREAAAGVGAPQRRGGRIGTAGAWGTVERRLHL